MARATRRIPIVLSALAAGGCLAAPPAPAEEVTGAARCVGDPGPAPRADRPWSIATLPGWSQGDAAATDLEDWLGATGVFTHVLHGSIAAQPDGTVGFAGGDLSGQAQACAGVVAAHSLGYPILAVLGGDRGDDLLPQATGDDARPALVASLFEFIDAHGYDGVSIAWIGGVEPDRLGALVGELADAFAARSPRPLLTVDLSSGTVPPSVTAGWIDRVDAVNLMSYGADWQAELDRHLAAGVPPEKIDLGIGLVLRDQTRASVQAKIDAAVAYRLHGVESWELGALDDVEDPRLLAYRRLLQ